MGRKKRKAVELDAANDAELAAYMPPQEDAPAPPPAAPAASVVEPEKSTTSAPASSSYAVTSHSAEIVGEDIYVSDGSEDEDEDADIVLAGSRMGLMRRGLHQPGLLQPNRQWQRETTGDNTEANDEEEEEKREQELAKLDPVERAKRLLAEKLRKLEEAKETARLSESQENAGRDPCLFSKRTAFDIRMDQMEDKQWENGSDPTDFFNYGFTEEDWVEYGQQQLQIRQELTDASRQRRPPDPNIVPVTPKTPHKQAPRVAVAVTKDNSEDDDNDAAKTSKQGEGPAIGPTLVVKDDKMDVDEEGGDEKKEDVSDIGGGAWGAGAPPGSHLAKLIEEQEQQASAAATPAFQQQSNQGDSFSDRGGGSDYYGGSGGGGGGDYFGGVDQDQYSPPVPPRGGHFPPSHGGPPPSFRGRGRGFGPPGPNNMPPPWAGRGRRGGFRGRYNGGYGGGYRR